MSDEMNVEEVEAGDSASTFKIKWRPDKEVKEYVDATFNYNFGADLTEAVENHGEDAVYNEYVKGARVSAQGVARRMAENGMDVDSIQDFLSSWTYGARGPSFEQSPAKAAINAIAKMDEDGLAALRKELEARGITV